MRACLQYFQRRVHIGGTHVIISGQWLTRWTGDNAFMQTGKNAEYDSHRRWPSRHRLHHSYTSMYRSYCNENNDLNANHVSAWPRQLPARCTTNRIQQYSYVYEILHRCALWPVTEVCETVIAFARLWTACVNTCIAQMSKIEWKTFSLVVRHVVEHNFLCLYGCRLFFATPKN